MATVVRPRHASSLRRVLSGLLRSLSTLALCCLAAVPALAQSTPRPLSVPVLTRGVLLVAHPNLSDPNFQQTVVLICEHGAQGTLGIIINRPTALLLSEALPNVSVLKGTSYFLFAGGPVHPDGVLMLFRVVETPDQLREIMEHVFLGLDQKVLERVITKPNPTETFRAYAGYAGWAPGQLEFEMAMGSWAVIQADPSSIFDKVPETLWGEMTEALQAPRVIRLE